MTTMDSTDEDRARRVDSIDPHGTLTAPMRDALLRVPREAFVPAQVWTVGDDDDRLLPINYDTDTWLWRECVLGDRRIVTMMDDGAAYWPHVGARATSMVPTMREAAAMLVALDVQPGHNVLTVTSGGGYVAALLDDVVGTGGRVVCTEPDKLMVRHIRDALQSQGSRVSVTIASGSEPLDLLTWDRVVSTASARVGHLPAAWIAETAAGGRIVAPVHTALTSGLLVGWDVDQHGVAVGRAHPEVPVTCPELWDHREGLRLEPWPQWDHPEARVRQTRMPTSAFRTPNDRLWSIAVAMPTVYHAALHGTGETERRITWLRDPVTGSWASAALDPPGAATVHQWGPRRLWDEAEAASLWFRQSGEPPLGTWVWHYTREQQTVRLPGVDA